MAIGVEYDGGGEGGGAGEILKGGAQPMQKFSWT